MILYGDPYGHPYASSIISFAQFQKFNSGFLCEIWHLASKDQKNGNKSAKLRPKT